MAIPTIDRPAPSPNHSNDNGNKLKKLGVKIIGGTAIALAGFGAYNLASKSTPDVDKIAHETIQEKLAQQKGDPYNGDPIVITQEVPAGVTIDNSSSKDFYKYFSQEQRVEWANDQLNQPSNNPEHVGMTVLEAKWAELDKKYNLPDAPKFLKDLVAPSESMTGNQILARHTVIANIISDEPSLDKQLKLLAVYIDPSNAALFNDRKATLEKGNDLQRGTGSVRADTQGTSMESPVFTTADPGNGYQANGIPSKIMNIGDSEGNIAGNVIRFYKGVPVLYDVYADGSPMNVGYPERIPAN